MTTKNPVGYYKYALAIDVETSGMAFCADNPTIDVKTGNTFQAVSFGVIVVNVDTMEAVKDLYLEVRMDPEHTFSQSAYKIHGLSEAYLEENGVSSEEAAVEIANLIMDFWGPNAAITLIGQNVASFDIWFIKQIFQKYDLPVKFSHRHIDTSTLGISVFGVYNSNDLFSVIGWPERDPSMHNALDDAYAALEVVRTVRKLSTAMLG